MFVCKDCGFQSPSRQGKCPYCGEWDTFSEVADESTKGSAARADYRTSMKISAIAAPKEERISSGNREIDRVLGGGIVKSSVLLLAGAPGIGKSTLLLQTAAALKKVLPDTVQVKDRGLPASGRQGLIALPATLLCWLIPAFFASAQPEWLLNILKKLGLG